MSASAPESAPKPLAVDPAWLARVAARADQPPLRRRLPLRWRGESIGSLDAVFARDLMDVAGTGAAPLLAAAGPGESSALELQGTALTPALAALADTLRAHGWAHVWRDEQLAVRDAAGRLLATVERAVVRPLGIATHAVHLVGRTLQGHHWVQQRALSKPNDPGLWDTLMGGMVPASDSLDTALARETWEEAGLRLTQLGSLQHQGRVRMRRPTTEGAAGGYVVEDIDWFSCTVPDGVTPQNQDGEVERFEALSTDALVARLHAEGFTTEAALILCAAGG